MLRQIGLLYANIFHAVEHAPDFNFTVSAGIALECVKAIAEYVKIFNRIDLLEEKMEFVV